MYGSTYPYIPSWINLLPCHHALIPRIIKYKGIMLKKVAHLINYSNTIPSILLGAGATRIYWLPLQAALQAALEEYNTSGFYQNLLLLDPVEAAVEEVELVPEAELDVAVDEELLPEVAISGPMVRLPQGG